MKKYWRSLEEYHDIPDLQEEKSETDHKNAVLGLFEDKVVSAKSSRRDFLRLVGFSVTSAALAASCERPVHKAIPYVIQPEEVTPGKSRHYASTFFDGKDFCPVVVKTRDGRPIKIEGNELSPFNQGGTTARVQASVLSLYDDARLKNPMIKGNETGWDDLDRDVLAGLAKAREEGKEIAILSPTIISPSTRKLIGEFSGQAGNVTWTQYDPISASAIREAHHLAYNTAIIPTLHIENASVLAAFNADFLGSWIAPVLYIRQYAEARRPDRENPSMLRHYQFESAMTLTGTNADHRIPVLPSEEKIVLASLYNKIASEKGSFLVDAPSTDIIIDRVAEDLLEAGEKGLVISGSNDLECQLLVIAINELLGSTGNCVDMESPLALLAGNDGEMLNLVSRMNEGQVGALLMFDVNPVYDYPDPGSFVSGLEKTGLSVILSGYLNETLQHAGYSAPVHHYLEAWDDAEIYPGHLSLAQPCIHPIFNTRSFQDSLLKWMGSDLDYHDYIQENWKENYFEGGSSFTVFWTDCLRDGVLLRESSSGGKPGYNNKPFRLSFSDKSSRGLEISLLDTVQMGDGRYANNPWLQELPDPVGKVCWENVVMVSPSDAQKFGLVNGTVINLNGTCKAPVLVQPGQVPGAVSIALGYGRINSGKVADGVGANAYPFVNFAEGNRLYSASGISLDPTGETVELALTQAHHSMEGRPIIREANLDEYIEKPDAGNEMHAEIEAHHRTLYPDVEFDGFHWGLAVDLNSCVGCNSCVIACQSENNIPVVGKDEVYRRRIMHWIKIDRYYSDEPVNPKVSYQPVMCQHCDNAPCENVCPVSATNHSSEGLNQMAYNRCVGTKYCINNCPYRARRFNWYKYAANDEFNYNMNSDLGKLVLNPDVTVRSRGVVEKCTFCVQRIQEKKLQAKLEGRKLEDGEIKTACMQACPANALVFGNLNDRESKVSRMFANERNYHLLEELHTLPSVGYLTRIRNEKKDEKS